MSQASITKNDFHFWYEDKVRFNDLDALGHASSVMINAYFAGARTKLFKLGVPEWPEGNVVPILKALTIDYKEELFLHDPVDIGLKIQKFGTTSFTLEMALFSDGILKATSTNVFVFVERDKKAKTDIPEEIKVKFIELTQPATDQAKKECYA